MSISSINIKPAKGNSEAHNLRKVDLDYNFSELEINNESWSKESIQNRTQIIHDFCKQKTGRALQKNATPIREAVVNLNANHSMEDLKKLASNIKEKFNVEVFQIHIHRDEGKSRGELNYHAHLVIDWQDKSTGKMKRHGKLAMSQLQTLVAETLAMERGELKENSNRERLEPVEYKRQQEELKLKLLQEQVQVLEQKKNRVARANTAAQKKHQIHREKIAKEEFNSELYIQNWEQLKGKASGVGDAIQRQLREAKETQREIERIRNQIEGFNKDEDFVKRQASLEQLNSEIRKFEEYIHFNS